MSTRRIVAYFGILSGMAWGIIAGFLGFFYFENPAIIFLTGAVAGFLVAFTIFVPLRKLRIKGSVLLGLVSLPLGAFYFGFLFFLPKEHLWKAALLGIDLVGLSLATPVTPALILGSVGTTLLLRKFILNNQTSNTSV